MLPAEVEGCFTEMGRVAVNLANSAQEVLLTRDPDKAARIREQDDEMDELHRQLFTVLMDREWKHGVRPRSMSRCSAASTSASPTTPSRSAGGWSFRPPPHFPPNKTWGRTRRPLACRGDQPVVPVVAVIQHAGAALGGLDKEQERQAEQAEPLGGLFDGEAWRRLRTDGHGQLKRAELIRRGGCYRRQAVARRAGAVQDTGTRVLSR